MKKPRATHKELDLRRMKLSSDFRILIDEIKRYSEIIKSMNRMSHAYTVEKNKKKIEIIKIIKQFRGLMNKRDWDILKMRMRASKPLTLEAVAKRYGVTRERIRQIESRAFNIIYNYFDNKL